MYLVYSFLQKLHLNLGFFPRSVGSWVMCLLNPSTPVTIIFKLTIFKSSEVQEARGQKEPEDKNLVQETASAPPRLHRPYRHAVRERVRMVRNGVLGGLVRRTVQLRRDSIIQKLLRRRKMERVQNLISPCISSVCKIK